MHVPAWRVLPEGLTLVLRCPECIELHFHGAAGLDLVTASPRLSHCRGEAITYELTEVGRVDAADLQGRHPRLPEPPEMWDRATWMLEVTDRFVAAAERVHSDARLGLIDPETMARVRAWAAAESDQLGAALRDFEEALAHAT